MDKRLVLFVVVVSILGLLAFAALGAEPDLTGYEFVKTGMCNGRFPCALFTKDEEEYLLVFDPQGQAPFIFIRMGKDGKQSIIWTADEQQG